LPDKEGRERLLVSISRADQVDRWQGFIQHVGQAAPESHHEGIPWLEVRLRSRDHLVAAASAYPAFPHASELAFRFPAAVQGVAVTVEGDLNNIVQECQQQVDAIVLANSPLSTDGIAAEAGALPSFEETKARMVKLFEECDYINIHAPGENSMGVDVCEEGREAWEMMTAAVAEAETGWVIPGQPQIYIWCETPDAPGRLNELNYIAGILGSPDPHYGGNVRTLRPAAAFGEGLDYILAAAREKEEKREQQQGRS
ncbi:MAG: hypothetical protein JSW71_06285, partial [Gemmatimonadota bacterium]